MNVLKHQWLVDNKADLNNMSIVIVTIRKFILQCVWVLGMPGVSHKIQTREASEEALQGVLQMYIGI